MPVVIRFLCASIVILLISLGLMPLISDTWLASRLYPERALAKPAPTVREPMIGTTILCYKDGVGYFPKWILSGNLVQNPGDTTIFHSAPDAFMLRSDLPTAEGSTELEFPLVNGRMILRGWIRMEGKPRSCDLSIHLTGDKTELTIPLLSALELCQGRPGIWLPFEARFSLPYDAWRNYLHLSLKGMGKICIDDLNLERQDEEHTTPEDFRLIMELPGARTLPK